MSTTAQSVYTELPLPITIGGTRVEKDKRVSGPPSRMLPELRDLGSRPLLKLGPAFGSREAQPHITIEVDTASERYTGAIRGLNHKSGALYLSLRKTTTVSIRASEILAFRVLKVEVEVPEVH